MVPMSFDDPFEEFKRKRDSEQSKFQQGQPQPAPAAGAQEARERLEKISDYFQAVKVEPAPAPKPPAPAQRPAAAHPPAAAPDARLTALCNLLVAKGVLTQDEARRVLGPN